MLGTDIKDLPALTHLNLPIILWDGDYHNSHFTDEEIKSQS